MEFGLLTVFHSLVAFAAAAAGLSLSAEKVAKIVKAERTSLREHGRVSFAGGVAPQLIRAFGDSSFLTGEHDGAVALQLVEAFSP